MSACVHFHDIYVCVRACVVYMRKVQLKNCIRVYESKIWLLKHSRHKRFYVHTLFLYTQNILLFYGKKTLMCGASNRLCCFFSSSFRPFSLLYINQPAIQGRRTHIKCFKSFFEYIHFFPSSFFHRSLRRAYAVRLCVHILKIILHVNVPWIGRKKIYALQSHRHRSERE